jgi:hypothetical protein
MITLDASMVRAFLREASQSGDRELVRTRFLNERATFQWMATWTLVGIAFAAVCSLVMLMTCLSVPIALATDKKSTVVEALFVLLLPAGMLAVFVGMLVYFVRVRLRMMHNLHLLDSEYATWQAG